jgi:hypothetical protein
MPMERPRQQPDEQQDPTRRPTPVLARTSSGVKVVPPPPEQPRTVMGATHPQPSGWSQQPSSTQGMASVQELSPRLWAGKAVSRRKSRREEDPIFFPKAFAWPSNKRTSRTMPSSVRRGPEPFQATLAPVPPHNEATEEVGPPSAWRGLMMAKPINGSEPYHQEVIVVAGPKADIRSSGAPGQRRISHWHWPSKFANVTTCQDYMSLGYEIFNPKNVPLKQEEARFQNAQTRWLLQLGQPRPFPLAEGQVGERANCVPPPESPNPAGERRRDLESLQRTRVRREGAWMAPAHRRRHQRLAKKPRKPVETRPSPPSPQ